MNKQSKILLSGFLIIILIMACGCSKPNVPVYEDEILSVKFPADWLWGGGYWGPGTKLFTVRNPKGIQPSATFSIATLKLVEDVSPELLIEQAYNSHGVVDNILAQVFKSDNLIGYEYNFYFGYGSASYHIREIWLENSGLTYILCFRAINHHQHEDAFQQVLESFHFIKE